MLQRYWQQLQAQRAAGMSDAMAMMQAQQMANREMMEVYYIYH